MCLLDIEQLSVTANFLITFMKVIKEFNEKLASPMRRVNLLEALNEALLSGNNGL